MTDDKSTGPMRSKTNRRARRVRVMLALLVAVLLVLPGAAFAAGGSFIGPLNQNSVVASTVPTNGDVNPYGLVVVPETIGNLVQGDVLVSNFNNSANLQGTGTTIVQVSPSGVVSQFAAIDPNALPGPCPGGVGLTGALAVVTSGWVIVGSLPTTDGTAATAGAGCLIVLDSSGRVVETIAGPTIDGPWGMTAADDIGAATVSDEASLFVSNVLNGTVAGNGQVVDRGTIVRIDLAIPPIGSGSPRVTSTTVVGSGFAERTDPAALVIGPQGLALMHDTLYVADSLTNRIAAIPDAIHRVTSARTGRTISSGRLIDDPLGIAIAPNGDILTSNGNNGLLVETTPRGFQVAAKLIDRTGSPPGAGCLFDLAITPSANGVYYADDCSNTLNLLH